MTGAVRSPCTQTPKKAKGCQETTNRFPLSAVEAHQVIITTDGFPIDNNLGDRRSFANFQQVLAADALFLNVNFLVIPVVLF